MESLGIYSFDIRKDMEVSPKDYIHYEIANLRRCLLYFDKILLDTLSLENRLDHLKTIAQKFNQEKDLKQLQNEIEYLEKYGLVSTYNFENIKRNSKNLIFFTELQNISDKLQTNKIEFEKPKSGLIYHNALIKEFVERHFLVGLKDEIKCRIVSSEIRIQDNLQACPINYI
jgi:hypothetical protein